MCSLSAGGARAELCALDDVPAATLLLPYFEVDVGDPHGVSTLISIVNTEGRSTLARVTLWTDLGLPTIGYDVYLTGFDVYTLNLRELFVTGRLPANGRTVSPLGDLSLPHTEFPDCAGDLGGLGPISPGLLADLVAAHRGQASAIFFEGRCGARDHLDDLVRGYATIDVVRRCSFLRPADEGYFGPGGVAGFENLLSGDYFVVDSSNNFAHGENLVRLEADAERFGAGDKTFYGAFVGWSGADGREPLPAVWATRFLERGGFEPATKITAWRGLLEPMAPFECGVLKSLPRMRRGLEWDEEENSFLYYPDTGLLDPPPPIETIDPFPIAASELLLADSPSLGPYSDTGWLLLDLRAVPPGHDDTDPDERSQAWVGTRIFAQGRFSVGMNGSPLSSACGEAGCDLGEQQEIGLVCLRGLSFVDRPGVEILQVGGPAFFEVRPAGCFSSSCTEVYQASCRVGEANGDGILPILSRFCSSTATDTTTACTADCNGGGFAHCQSEPLAAGVYHASFAGFSLTFSVPSEIPAGGLCVDAGCPICAVAGAPARFDDQLAAQGGR